MDSLSALENLYISPLELCNLACRSCYTKKTKPILSNTDILDFVTRYRQHTTLKSIILCGGEVFTLPHFPQLVNQLQSRGLFVSIITNGTIDRLLEINDPKNCQLIVSFDGPKDIHDQNRGVGNYQKSLHFVEQALELGFHLEIFYLVTKDSYPYIDTFPQEFNSYFINHKSYISFIYLTDRLRSLSREQVLHIKRNYATYPSKNLGCFQVSLQSNGLVYGCCESHKFIGKISDPIESLLSRFHGSLTVCQRCPLSQSGVCGGCTDPTYLCGYIDELNSPSCPHVIKSFQ